MGRGSARTCSVRIAESGAVAVNLGDALGDMLPPALDLVASGER